MKDTAYTTQGKYAAREDELFLDAEQVLFRVKRVGSAVGRNGLDPSRSVLCEDKDRGLREIGSSPFGAFIPSDHALMGQTTEAVETPLNG